MWNVETDNPEDHPLWERQVSLERGMRDAGAEDLRERTVKAREKGQMTRINPVRNLMSDWMEPLAQAIKQWLRDVARARGAAPLAAQYVSQVDPYKCALITLREVLDGLASERQTVSTLASTIGRVLEHEAQVQLWEKTAPDLYYAEEKRMTRQGSTAIHRKRVNIHKFNELMREGTFGVHWVPWGHEATFRAGAALVDLLIKATGWFEVDSDPTFVPPKSGGFKSPKLILQPKPALLEWLGRALDREEATSPQYKPTVMPPKRWDGTKGGGYYTPFVKAPRLVRFKASEEGQREWAAEEYEGAAMPTVYAALHMLQETPWRVNTRVLEVAVTLWNRGGGVAGLPVTDLQELPPKPLDIDTNEDARRDWKREASEVRANNNRLFGRCRATRRTLQVAFEYRDFEAIYFPHMLDFRGRMYPIPVGLQPQGNDLARGLLTFSERKPITTENGGVRWLAIHLASMAGHDKISMDDRVKWVLDHEATLRRIAADPLEHTEWMTWDKGAHAFLTLAAIFEWVGYLEHGEGYPSSLPVSVDGTCNGIQHLSAITRDAVAGAQVNLVPGPTPRDIYKEVARRLQIKVSDIAAAGGEEGRKAAYWLDVTGGELPRSLTKRQVMVLPYGGTKEAFFEYTREWLDSADPLVHPKGATWEERKAAFKARSGHVVFLAKHLWDVVNEVVEGGLTVMRWLQDTAKFACEADQPIFWTVPSGFVVRHFYGQTRTRKVELLLDGTRRQLRLTEYTTELDSQSQLRGISPNFVHSLDASAQALTIVRCKELGLGAFTAVHDNFGTHAADMVVLARTLRKCFVETHEVSVLDLFRNGCARVLTDTLVAAGVDEWDAALTASTKLPPMLKPGTLDLAGVLESEYFFA